MIVDSGKYYIYRHVRLDNNQVFYIGLGTKYKKGRCILSIYCRAYSKNYRNKFWLSIVNKSEYRTDILLESDDYDFIERKEIEFIKLYGRRNLGEGTLVNLNDGGNSNHKMIVSEETRRKQSLAKKDIYKVSEETKNKLREIYKGIRPCKLAIENADKAKLRPVSQFDQNGNWIRDFDSIKSAVKYLKLSSHSSISSNLHGRYKSAGGYIWKFKKN